MTPGRETTATCATCNRFNVARVSGQCCGCWYAEADCECLPAGRTASRSQEVVMSGLRPRRSRRRCEGCDKLTLTRTYSTDLPGEVVPLCDPCRKRWDVEDFLAAQARDAFMGEPDPQEDDDA